MKVQLNFIKLIMTCMFILVSSLHLVAQEIDFCQDTAFFFQKLPTYEKWLKASGLGQVLKVHDIEIKKKSFAIKLGFHYLDSDSASVAWNKLKENFKNVSPFSLERQLFYKMTHILEVPPTNAKVYVSDNWDLTQIPCLDGKIYLRDGVIKSTISFCRAVSNDITLEDFVLKENLILLTKEVKNKKLIDKKNRKKIYRVIEKNARKYFEREGVTFSVLERDSVMRFEVMNIKREVFIGSWVDWFDPHELLSFTLKYTPKVDGITIYCEIDGKYGSGLFKPRSLKGFRDMSEEYMDELKRYTERFTTEKIADWLSRSFD